MKPKLLSGSASELINTDPLPGIRALIETSGIQLGKISSGQIVYVLAPRINAVGRWETPTGQLSF